MNELFFFEMNESQNVLGIIIDARVVPFVFFETERKHISNKIQNVLGIDARVVPLLLFNRMKAYHETRSKIKLFCFFPSSQGQVW